MWEFFKIIVAPIIKLFDWLKQFLLGWFGWLLGILAFLLIPINYFLDLIISFFTFLNARITSLTTSINNFWDNLTSTYSSVASVLSVANALFPLSTLFIILYLLFILWIIGIIYRAVKSYIPTLS